MAKRGALRIFCCLWILMVAGAVPPARASQEPDTVVRYVPRWDLQQSGVDDDLNDVMFLNDQLGWAVGKNNTILRTTDGGQTWTRLLERREGGPNFIEVTFASPTEGWVLASTTLLFTTNGGETWRPSTLPEGFSAFSTAAAVVGSTRFQGYDATGASRLVRTDNGGNSWTRVGGPQARFPSRSARLFFSEPNRAWVIVQGLNSPTLLARSEDGGITWTTLDHQLNYFARGQFVNPSTGWVLGEDGTTVLATVDGGGTWERQFTGLDRTAPLTDLHFVNEPLGHILSGTQGGQVIRTTDGGWSWGLIGRLEARGTNLSAISFPDAEHGWVVGDRGFIIHYHLVQVVEEALPATTE